MLRAFLFVLSCSGSLALIVNQAEYGDTTLVYYDQYDDSVSPPGAITRCSQRGGWLVMPKDPHLNSEVIALVKDSRVWIGMGDYGIEGAYEFNDGSQFTWADWGQGQPDNAGNEDCGGILGKRWNDYPCDSHYGYVCQIPKFRSLPYERSHLKVYYGVNETTYRGAITACQKIGSRLMRIKNERESEILSGKFTQLSGNDFWVSTFGVNTRSCYVNSGGVVTADDCDRSKPFACEAVEPHKVVISEKHPTVDTSSYLQISCSAYGFPTPEVTWVRDGKEVKDQEKKKGHSTMNLHDVNLQDAGLYVCQATNVIDNREYKMEAYSFVEVTQGKNGEQQQWDDNDMY